MTVSQAATTVKARNHVKPVTVINAPSGGSRDYGDRHGDQDASSRPSPETHNHSSALAAPARPDTRRCLTDHGGADYDCAGWEAATGPTTRNPAPHISSPEVTPTGSTRMVTDLGVRDPSRSTRSVRHTPALDISKANHSAGRRSFKVEARS